MRKNLGIIAVGLLAFGAANAGPILVEPSASTSEVSAEITSESCIYCSVDVALSEDLNDVEAWLDSGESVTFDFFELLIGGLIGTAEIAIDATLGLSSPVATADGEGIGGFASFLFVFNGVQLNWIQPGDIDLGDGTFLSVTFENLYEFIIGNTVMVSATVNRYDATTVPEPATSVLLLVGLFALWFSSRRSATNRRPHPREFGDGDRVA